MQTAIDSLTQSISQKAQLIADLQAKDTNLSQQITALQNKDADLTNALAGKLNASNVTQSRSVTTAGYAVDARELNAGVAGSFAQNIASNMASANWWCPIIRDSPENYSIDNAKNPGCYYAVDWNLSPGGDYAVLVLPASASKFIQFIMPYNMSKLYIRLYDKNSNRFSEAKVLMTW